MSKRNNLFGNFANMGRNNLLVIAGISLIALSVLILVAVGLNFDFSLQLNGEHNMKLVYGQDTYEELGATASANDKQLDVEISGEVDVTKLGTYEITYKASHLWVTKKVVREVKVVDTTAPVITLKTVPGYLTPPGEDYQEEGYTAEDDYDGDITANVQKRIVDDVVYYTVSDASGNITTVERPIVRKDVVAPTITLKGDATITINAGSAYTEPGYTANDNIDGDITDKVAVSGTVNIYHAGEYTLTYTVKDAYDNEATVERKVVVVPIKQPETVNPNGKVVYLTFDDGPRGHTQRLLDILAQYNAKATFFVINTGHNMKANLNAIVNGGHGIAIHSVSHEYSEIYASEEAFFNDLYGMQKIIKDATGVTTTMMRFPGGSSNTVSKFNPGIMTRLTKAVTDQGFQYFDWNVSSGDAGGVKGTNAEKTAQIVTNVINGISKTKNPVVLQHDIHGFSVDAVEQILIWGIENGYSFQALTPSSPVCHHGINN